jgi:hypothetical protein
VDDTAARLFGPLRVGTNRSPSRRAILRRRVALRPRLRSSAYRSGTQCAALSHGIFAAYIFRSVHFFSTTGSLILTQQILTCTYRYHCIVHVPAYSRTGRQVYTVTSYMKALQHVAGTWPSLLRAWTRSPGDAQTLGATHTQASIFDPIVSWANTRSGRDIFYWALHNPSSRRSQIMARRVKQGPSLPLTRLARSVYLSYYHGSF